MAKKEKTIKLTQIKSPIGYKPKRVLLRREGEAGRLIELQHVDVVAAWIVQQR